MSAGPDHSHTMESRSNWNGSSALWTLGHRPEVAGELILIKGGSPPTFLLPTTDFVLNDDVLTFTVAPTAGVEYYCYYSFCDLDAGAVGAVQSSNIFIAIAGNIIYQGTVSGTRGNLSLSLGTSITITASHNIITMTGVPGNNNLLYVGVTASSGANMRLLLLDFTASTTTEVWTKTEVNSQINNIYCISSTECYFVVRNEVTTLSNAVYKSADGTTFTSAGKGYDTGVSLSPIVCHAIAVASSGASRRIYIQHNNANYLDSINTPEMMSYSDDGATWHDVLSTGINRFVGGDYGYVSLVPDGSDATRVNFSNANSGGGIQTPYLTGLTPTLNPQMTSILDSSFVEGGFYVQPLKRFLADRTRFWISSDAGATWIEGTSIGVSNATETRLHRGYSVLPSHDWVGAVTQASKTLYVMDDYATWQIFTLPDFGRAVAWVGGRN